MNFHFILNNILQTRKQDLNADVFLDDQKQLRWKLFVYHFEFKSIHVLNYTLNL